MKWHFGKSIAVVYGVFAVSMLGAAVRSTHYDVGLVQKNYYEGDLNYQRRFDNIQNEKRSSERVRILLHPDRLGVDVLFPKNQPSPTGKITFFRPSKMGLDKTYDIVADAENKTSISTQNILPGLWKVQIEWTAKGVGYYREEYLTF